MGSGSGGSTALRAGNRLGDNIDSLKEKYPLNSSGYFGTKGEGRSHTRNIASDNPARTAAEFASLASRNPVTVETISGKGLIYTMRDGSVVTHRFTSSSKDHSPVVELKVHDVPGVRSQKIHFTKKGK